MSKAIRQLLDLVRLLKEVDEIYDEYAATQNVAESTLWILYAVHTHEGDRPYTQKELCQDWSESPKTINSAVKKLQERSLVELVSLPGSRREKGIVLTEAGNELARKLVSPLVIAEENAINAIREADLAAAFRALTTYRDVLEKGLGASK